VLDLRCEHCARIRRPLLDALAGARITEHVSIRPSDPLGRRLAHASLSAAAEGPLPWERFMTALLGTPRDAELPELLASHGNLLSQRLASPPAPGALAVAEQALQRTGYQGTTPYLRLRDTVQGTVHQAAGTLDVQDILMRIAQAP